MQFVSWDVDVAAMTVDDHAPRESVRVGQPDGIRRQWLPGSGWVGRATRRHDTVTLTRRRREGGVGG